MTFTDYDYLQKMKKSMLNALERKGIIKDKNNDKYIIKNCPMYFHGNCYGHTGNCDCSDCTDCVMKQIVELCNKEIKVYRNTLLPNDGTNTLHFGRQSFAYDILQLLGIQEV